MKNNTLKSFGMAGLNALAIALNLFPAHANTKPAPTSDLASQPEAINTASIKAIESTWLKIPGACKAAGFNAQPIALKNDFISAQAAAVYQSFGA